MGKRGVVGRVGGLGGQALSAQRVLAGAGSWRGACPSMEPTLPTAPCSAHVRGKGLLNRLAELHFLLQFLAGNSAGKGRATRKLELMPSVTGETCQERAMEFQGREVTSMKKYSERICPWDESCRMSRVACLLSSAP